MNESILEELAITKQKLKTLSDREKELKSLVLEELEKSGEKNLKKDYAQFTKTVVPVWQYSDSVKKIEEDVKMLKIDEQENGIAKKKERVQLTVKLIK